MSIDIDMDTGIADPECFGMMFRQAASGRDCWIRQSEGHRRSMPIGRWLGGAHASRGDRDGDTLLLESCTGSTVDLGCGPGRFAAELAQRGRVALGVDSSPAAVEMTRQRGADALLGSIFDAIPGEGFWSSVLLADGNIGIGGDPLKVLRRARELMADTGRVVAEVDKPGTGLRRERLRFESDGRVGQWYDWARVDPAYLETLAPTAGLAVESVTEHAGRFFVVLVPSNNVTSWSPTGG